MANQITGRLVAIGMTETLQTKSGSTYQKRDFLLDARTYDPFTGEPSQYENLLPLEVGGERCADLDRFRVGDTVTVSFALQGRTWKTADGQEKRLTSVRCYKIEPYSRGNAQAPQPVPQPAQQAATTFPPKVDRNGEPDNNDPLPF